MSNKKILFVYGSLLSGLHNHMVLDDPSTKFLGEWTTSPNYTMKNLGSFPGVLEGGDTAIRGELYAVSEDVYARVEHLEGYPTFYDRKPLRTDLGEAEVYVLCRERYSKYPDVENGDWRGYVEVSRRYKSMS